MNKDAKNVDIVYHRGVNIDQVPQIKIPIDLFSKTFDIADICNAVASHSWANGFLLCYTLHNERGARNVEIAYPMADAMPMFTAILMMLKSQLAAVFTGATPSVTKAKLLRSAPNAYTDIYLVPFVNKAE